MKQEEGEISFRISLSGAPSRSISIISLFFTKIFFGLKSAKVKQALLLFTEKSIKIKELEEADDFMLTMLKFY